MNCDANTRRRRILVRLSRFANWRTSVRPRRSRWRPRASSDLRNRGMRRVPITEVLRFSSGRGASAGAGEAATVSEPQQHRSTGASIILETPDGLLHKAPRYDCECRFSQPTSGLISSPMCSKDDGVEVTRFEMRRWSEPPYVFAFRPAMLC